jgi:hypothetical protein
LNGNDYAFLNPSSINASAFSSGTHTSRPRLFTNMTVPFSALALLPDEGFAGAGAGAVGSAGAGEGAGVGVAGAVGSAGATGGFGPKSFLDIRGNWRK